MAPPSKTAAGRPAKAPAAKKASAPKKVRSHPPYFEMIKEAIMALKERTGSSPYAIAKFIEEKQKDLPANFKKLMSVQLKKLVASGKLTKVKNSFKLSAPVKPAAAGEKKPKKPVAPKKAPAAAAGAKRKRAADGDAEKKKKAKKKATASAAAKVKKTPVKKAPAKKAVKKTPVKKPKSIKSPAKKMKK